MHVADSGKCQNGRVQFTSVSGDFESIGQQRVGAF